jgi:hypothetical protein
MGPWLFPLIGVLFLSLGFFTVILARKRLRQTRALGQPAIWYKDLTLLTGLEYTLLGINVFLDLSRNWIPAQFQLIFTLFFMSILLVTVIILLAVVFLLIKQPRQTRQVSRPVPTTEADTDTRSPAERAVEVQRKRERRQKAAAARRRHSGRA